MVSPAPNLAPRRWIVILVAASLTLNLLGAGYAGWVIRGRGGLQYLASALKLSKTTGTEANRIIVESYDEKFRSYPLPRLRPVTFLGDSLTAQAEWRELLGHDFLILNRGIGGDTSAGVLARIGTVTAARPSAVFLMIGTNDPQLLNYSPADTVARWRDIIGAIRTAVPDCKVYVESVLPSRSPKFNGWSAALNEELKKLAASEQLAYIDLRSSMLDAQGLLKAEYTWDGLHLSAAGYRVWRDRVAPLVRQHAVKFQQESEGFTH